MIETSLYRFISVWLALIVTLLGSYPISESSLVAETHEHQCGRVLLKFGDKKKKGRIVNGSDSVLGETPWFAALVHNSKPFCGGSIIDNRHILTVAHCVEKWYKKPANRSVRVGSIVWMDFQQEISIESVTMHPHFSSRIYLHDIAVLKLDQDIVYNDYVQPICLPEPEMTEENLVNQMATVVGYGDREYNGPAASKLQRLDVKVLPKSACGKYFKSNLVSSVGYTKSFLCAGYIEGGKDSCNGDSGGPLTIERKNINYLVAIVTFGYECATPGYPGVYTKVANYRSFIHSSME